MKEAGAHALATGESFHFERYFAPAGKWLNVQIYKVDECIGVVLRDITNRKVAEAQLQESELRFRTYVDKMQIGVVVQDPGAHIFYANPRALELLKGRAPKSARGMTASAGATPWK